MKTVLKEENNSSSWQIRQKRNLQEKSNEYLVTAVNFFPKAIKKERQYLIPVKLSKLRKEGKKKKRLTRDLMPSFIIRNSEQPWPQNRSFGTLATYFILHLGPLLAPEQLMSELHFVASGSAFSIHQMWGRGSAVQGRRLCYGRQQPPAESLWLTSLPLVRLGEPPCLIS